MKEFLKLTIDYSEALRMTLEANNKLREILGDVVKGRDVLRRELNVTDAATCSICMDRPKVRALLPCGHIYCNTCAGRVVAQQVSRCPNCRAPVHRSTRVYVDV